MTMGNSPSASVKPPNVAASSSASPSANSHGRHSPRPLRPGGGARQPQIPVPIHSVAAPPEPSLAQAQGTTCTSTTTAITANIAFRPKSVTQLAPTAFSSSSVPARVVNTAAPFTPPSAPQRPAAYAYSASVHVPSEPRNVPARPVDVPLSSPLPQSPPFQPASAPRTLQSPLSTLSDRTSANTMVAPDLPPLPRPPRMPLPIEEEIHSPGSPIIAPADLGSYPITAPDLDSTLPRQASSLSSNTGDDEELDAEELAVDKSLPTVPTRIEWLRGGEKVYVTGSLFQWSRKMRLLPAEGRPGVFATTIHVLPGTHHIRFLVDGKMVTSEDLPTTTDFGSNLVNYIAVKSEHAAADEPSVPTPAEMAPQKVYSAGLLKKVASVTAGHGNDEHDDDNNSGKAPVMVDPTRFTTEIPQYIIDYDEPDGSPAYYMALAATKRLPRPLMLPDFLSKPIHNAVAPIKDDNSVLIMPNHTVLNHLVTTSIRDKVLAVSATTRYKAKYVTAIIYKPTDVRVTDDERG